MKSTGLELEVYLWETVGMAYIPRPNDPVTVDGVDGRLVVIGVDKMKKTAVLYTTTTPTIRLVVEWSKLSYLDESQNALRVVREATED